MTIRTNIRPGQHGRLALGASVGGWKSIETMLIRLFDTLLAWQERANQRHRLQELDDRMLRDVALSRADLDAEIAKPFWR